MEIEVEPDARPIVRILAQVLRRSAREPELAQIMDSLTGVLGLRSTTDPQKASIYFDEGSIYLEGGISADADVVIATDFNAPTGPDAPKPSLRQNLALAKAAGRHPKFAAGAAKVLEPPLPGWKEAASSFWDLACRRGPTPEVLRVVCYSSQPDGEEAADAHEELVFERDQLKRASGPDTGGQRVELYGDERSLTRCLVGDDVIAEAAVQGRIEVVADISGLSIVTGTGLALMLGEDPV